MKGFKGKEKMEGAPSVKGEREPWRQILREGSKRTKHHEQTDAGGEEGIPR
jgi:hypothetical protein